MSRANKLNFFSVLKSYLPAYSNRNADYGQKHPSVIQPQRVKKALSIYTQICPLSAKIMNLMEFYRTVT